MISCNRRTSWIGSVEKLPRTNMNVTVFISQAYKEKRSFIHPHSAVCLFDIRLNFGLIAVLI